MHSSRPCSANIAIDKMNIWSQHFVWSIAAISLKQTKSDWWHACFIRRQFERNMECVQSKQQITGSLNLHPFFDKYFHTNSMQPRDSHWWFILSLAAQRYYARKKKHKLPSTRWHQHSESNIFESMQITLGKYSNLNIWIFGSLSSTNIVIMYYARILWRKWVSNSSEK